MGGENYGHASRKVLHRRAGRAIAPVRLVVEQVSAGFYLVRCQPVDVEIPTLPLRLMLLPEIAGMGEDYGGELS